MAYLRYQCRRGMLELDAIFHPFFEKHYLSLTDEEKKEFECLLACSDQDLFSWLVGAERPHDPSLQHIVQKVRDLRASSRGLSARPREHCH
jgi:antitoxin CptB